MKSCGICKYRKIPYDQLPCDDCIKTIENPYWEPNHEIAELIEAAERKAFQAARKKSNFSNSFDANDLKNRPYYYNDFEQYKEESKKQIDIDKVEDQCLKEEVKAHSKSYQQQQYRLFVYFVENHGLSLTFSEIEEVVWIVRSLEDSKDIKVGQCAVIN